MALDFLLYTIGVWIFIIFLVILFILSRKVLVDKYPGGDFTQLQQSVITRFQEKNIKVKIRGNKLYLQNGSFSSAGLFLKQTDQGVEIYRFSSATDIAWILIAVGIVTWGLITVVVAFISECNSRKFMKEIIVPLLKEL